MLIGRDAELREAERLVGSARVAQSGVLVVVGEAGIGKTALLDHVAATSAASVRVLRARGEETERGLPFAVLHQLLLPVLDQLDRIPGPQADALGVALALRAGSADRFAVGAATLSLLSRCAEEGPVLLLVDDVHAVDRPSAEALVFACRRMVADPVATLLASRPAPGGPLLEADLPRIVLDGLSGEHVRELLASRTTRSVVPEVAEKVRVATGGNPLAVMELAERLEQVERTAPHTPVEAPERVLGEFARRVEALSPSTRRALLVAAVAGERAVVVQRALGRLGGAIDDLRSAETAGLVRLSTDRVEFRHPLVRSSVYATSAPELRRRAHLAVSEAQPPTDPDRRAWHLSEATIGSDPTVAAAVAAVAERADARGAHSIAVAAYERAAQHAVDDASRARLLHAAGESAGLAGRTDRATSLLQAVGQLHRDPVLRARGDGVQGNLEMRSGSLDRARSLLAHAAEVLSPTDPDSATVLSADVVTACFLQGASAAGLEAAGRLEALLPRTTSKSAEVRGRMAVGIARILAGQPGIDLVRTAVEELERQPVLTEGDRSPSWMITGTLFLRESATGRALARRVTQELRERCALGALPILLFHIARDEATTDRWNAARSAYGESIELARETDQAVVLAMSLAGRAWLHAHTGDAVACGQDTAEAEELAKEHDVHLARAWSLFAEGDLELGLGRPTEALVRFRELEEFLAEFGLQDVDLSPAAEIVESLARLGQRSDAEPVARTFLARARAKGQPWSIARAERALGMLAAPQEAVRHFEEAVAWHRRSPDAFEEARTWLAHGASLRRGRRRVAARECLRTALAGFESLGARPWAEQAAVELQATGEHPHRRGDRSIDLLTPQEQQIAELLAGGRTTREAATTLFLSPKTVEYHLRHVYTKLGIRSRAELAAAIDGTELDA